MFIFQVHHYIKPEMVEAYKAATLENARKTIAEPGIVRFDVFQDAEDPTHFSLLEIYRDEAAREAHLQTGHFKAWAEVYYATRERVGNGNEFTALFPDEKEWG